MGCDDGGTTKDSGKLFCALLNLGVVAISIFSSPYNPSKLKSVFALGDEFRGK